MKEEMEIKEKNLQKLKLDLPKYEEVHIEDYYIEEYEGEAVEGSSQILKEEEYFPKLTEIFIKQHVEKDTEENSQEINKKKKKKKYACTYLGCSRKFAKPCLLQRHICLHTGERPYKCNFENCDKAYTNMSYLNRHKMTHQGPKIFHRCEHCLMEFSESHNLKRHINRIHILQKPDKPCEFCCLVFKTRNLLQAHMIRTHDRKLYNCKLCTKTFGEPSKLRKHLQSNIHREHSCTICSTKFSNFDDFKNHVKQEHTVFYSEFTCDICGKTFKQKSTLSLHVQDHMQNRLFTCTIEGCARIFYYQRNLNYHISSYHLGRKHECHRCGAELSTKQKLQEHIEKIHENPVVRKPPPTKENRKRRCDAGKPKRSAVSKLTGVILPPKVEKELLHRHDTKYEDFYMKIPRV